MSREAAPLRVAVQHGAPDGAAPADRLARAEELLAAAAAAGAGLLVLPQLFLGGPDPAHARRAAELSDGPSARRLAAAAAARGVALLCGYPERCSGRFYDAALFFDDRGRAVANYRRIHLVPEADEPVFAHGQWLTIVPFRGLKLGLLLGCDLEGPEQARALALAGAGFLLAAARHGPRARLAGGALLHARAVENGCALAYANGEVGPGAPASRVIGPEGELLAATEGGLAVAEVRAAEPARAHARDLARRPRLYQRLLAALPGEEAPRL